MNIIRFCLGFLCCMLTVCYWKLCEIATYLKPKHQ